MKCPYCGKLMKDETGPEGAIIAASCDGRLFRRHARIIVSRLDNKFRTLDGAIAKELEAKGYAIRLDSNGKYYEIAHTLGKAGELSPQAQINFDLGWAFWKSGERKKAVEVWEDNVRQFPTHRDSWYNLGLAYGRDDQFQRAIECLKKVIEIDPSDGQAWWYLGFTYRMNGDQINSKQAYAKAKALGWQQVPM
jgi:tetratricopeptide (TPR) repeat protein